MEAPKPQEAPNPRSRAALATAAAVVVALGLASRAYRADLPAWVGAYAGDALWAVVAFLAGAFLFPAAPTRKLALGAGLFALAIELSQLHHAPWIDRIRALPGAKLLLGDTFVFSDLLCYAVGIALAALVDAGLRRGAGGSIGAAAASGLPGTTATSDPRPPDVRPAVPPNPSGPPVR